MSKDKALEDFVRLQPADSHTDARRSIIDVPVGYLHGRRMGVSNIISLSDQDIKLPLGQHFHNTYKEVFALVAGSGHLYVRAVEPGETNRVDPTIVVAQELPHYFDRSLYGAQAQLEVDAKDPMKKLLRIEEGIAHTFVLKPGSVLVAYLVDVPTGFNPKDAKNFQKFPLL